MKMRIAAVTVVATVAAGGAGQLRADMNQASMVFVGTTPCSDALRAFLDGGAAGAGCPAITWQLDLGVAEGQMTGWSLTASYTTPLASNPRRAVDAPEVSARGRLEKSGATYRLISQAGKAISFRQISPALIHVLDDQNKLMAGNSAYSYTLSRSDALDDRGQPEMRQGESYSLSPKESGPALFGMFVGRSPCMGIARALRIALNDGCQRVKWRITLLQRPGTHDPTTYKIQGSLHHTARTGAWRIVRGIPSDPNAVVYQLDAAGSEAPMLLWKADDDVLVFLDERKQPLVGTVDFSYTLNRGQL